MSKRARRRQKRPNAPAKALSSGLFRTKVGMDRLAVRLIRSTKYKSNAN